jgi:release factor glutamine methyltransferase
VRDWEPAAALFAGARGLDVLDALVAGAGERLRPGGLLALEVGLGQAEAVCEGLRKSGSFAEPRVRRDLAGRPRIVLAERG